MWLDITIKWVNIGNATSLNLECCVYENLAYIWIPDLDSSGGTNLREGESRAFREILEQVLGLGSITRDGFFEILENMKGKKLSTPEFFKLLEIIAQQELSSS